MRGQAPGAGFEMVRQVKRDSNDWREVSDTPRQLRPTVEGLTDEADGV